MLDQFVQATAGFALYVLIGVGIFTAAETFLPTHKIRVRDKVRGILFAIVPAPLFGASAVVLNSLPITPIVRLHAGFGSPIIAAVALALWIDFQFYWMHRIQHRFLWRFHAVHHSIQNLCAANAYHHWTEPLWIFLLAGVPLLFVDVQIGPTLGFLSALFRYQSFFIHSPSKLQLGPFRWLLIDAPYHRIHHSTEADHHDRNFGAMTPLWDWLFGTLYMPEPKEWPDVGLAEVDEPANLAEWSSLPWRYARQTRVAEGPWRSASKPIES